MDVSNVFWLTEKSEACSCLQGQPPAGRGFFLTTGGTYCLQTPNPSTRAKRFWRHFLRDRTSDTSFNVKVTGEFLIAWNFVRNHINYHAPEQAPVRIRCLMLHGRAANSALMKQMMDAMRWFHRLEGELRVRSHPEVSHCSVC